jgi:succinoglycan biosynthesis transport protein ExoP
MQLQDYLRILRRRWMFILGAALMGLTASAAFAFFQTPAYQATAQLFVSVKGTATATDVTQGNSFAEKRVTSYVSLATSPRVLQAAADDLGLNGGFRGLTGKVTASAPPQTVLIDLKATDADPEMAARIANSTAKELIDAVASVEDVSLVRLSIFESATQPTTPVSPNVPLILSLGIVLGLLFGLGMAVVREVLDTGLRSQEDIARVTSAGVLGSFRNEKHLGERPLITRGDLYSPRAEAFRQLRTHLHFTNLSGGTQSLVVSSSIPGEGKTSTAVNLAIMLAESGVRVLLVDADLRRPRVAKYLGLEASVGLSTVLSHRIDLEDAIQPWGPGGGLDVLTAGSVAPNPTELLGSPMMEKLIKNMEDVYEVIIIDSPPLLPVADPAILAALSSGVMLVTSVDGRTQKKELQKAIENVEAVNGRLVGLVVNRLPHDRGEQSYYDYKPDKPDETPARKRKKRTSTSSMRHA